MSYMSVVKSGSVIIVRHDNGDLQFDLVNRSVKGRCVGRDGFKEQMNFLKSVV